MNAPLVFEEALEGKVYGGQSGQFRIHEPRARFNEPQSRARRLELDSMCTQYPSNFMRLESDSRVRNQYDTPRA